jgi:uncharacterized glyoxalase superfamily protein PhnB
VGPPPVAERVALAAGATPAREPQDQFYGDRSGGVNGLYTASQSST